MVKNNISNKILYWYDNNKRDLPWRKPKSKKQSQYYTLVSEIMLQQTQVNTVIPYFKNFISQLPNFNKLSKVPDRKLLKMWEGLGYYSRAKNLRKSAKIIVNHFNNKLPDSFENLKKLPGVGDYTSKAILALEFNKKVIPIDGNIERLIKRIFLLKNFDEISKQNLIIKSSFFGESKRQRDYVQALMELGALTCKPREPLCNSCPINNYCMSYKFKDFDLIKKIKKIKTKYFKANIYMQRDKMFLIKNKKFNFLKNHLIFPMIEIKELEYKSSLKKKTNIKISNIDMKILINKTNNIPPKKGIVIKSNNISSEVLPSFTKKIFRLALSQ
tara:strand:+ start:3649 stop:4635 length:987 start_codon:yes stop_codon:yes gene_type:complete